MGKSLYRGFCRKDWVRVGTGECERCQDSGAQGPSLVVWYLALAESGRECESDKGDGWAGFWSGWFAFEKHVQHPPGGRTPKVRLGSEGGRRPRPGGLGTLMACPEQSVLAYACRQRLWIKCTDARHGQYSTVASTGTLRMDLDNWSPLSLLLSES